MLVIALPGPRNGRHDAELRHADCLGNVRLMLSKKTPKHGSEPDLQPPPHCRVRVVLVVPELVCELSSLHRKRDRDDDISESPPACTVSATARIAEPVTRIDRSPAGTADTSAAREDRDEMVYDMAR